MDFATVESFEMDTAELRAYRETNLTPGQIKIMAKKLLIITTALDSEDDYAPNPHITDSCPIPDDFWKDEAAYGMG